MAFNKGYANAPGPRRQGVDESRPPAAPPSWWRQPKYEVDAPANEKKPKTKRQKRNERQATREHKLYRAQEGTETVAPRMHSPLIDPEERLPPLRRLLCRFRDWAVG